MEKSGFFNARKLEDENGLPILNEDGSQKYDREYNAGDFAALFSMFFSSGIKREGDLRVFASGNGTNIKIDTGRAMINGYYYMLTEPLILNLKLPNAPMRKYYRVVLRLDLRQDVGRKISIEVLESVAELSPKPNELTRNNEVYELGLADILLTSMTTTITEGNITDLRLNNSFCGLI